MNLFSIKDIPIMKLVIRVCMCVHVYTYIHTYTHIQYLFLLFFLYLHESHACCLGEKRCQILKILNENFFELLLKLID